MAMKALRQAEKRYAHAEQAPPSVQASIPTHNLSNSYSSYCPKLVNPPSTKNKLRPYQLSCRDHGHSTQNLAALMKIANDLRWLASGPRCGLAVHLAKMNRLIMPGKVNPLNVREDYCLRPMMANDQAITIAASGNFELNVFKPVIIRLLQHHPPFRCLSSLYTIRSKDLNANKKQIAYYLSRSLMLVTAWP